MEMHAIRAARPTNRPHPPRVAMLLDPDLTLREARALLVRLLEHVDVDLLIHRLDAEAPRSVSRQKVVATSRTTSAAAGVDFRELVGHTVGERMPELSGSEIGRACRDVLASGEPVTLDQTRYGDDFIPENVFSIRVVPLDDEHLGIVARDVTDLEQALSHRRQTLKVLAERARDLKRSNDALDEFAYVASHDLQSPLRDLENLCEWISEDIEQDLGERLPRETARHLQLMRDRVVRMRRMLDDLLAYSRVGRRDHAVGEVDLRELVEDTVRLVEVPPEFDVVAPEAGLALTTPRVPLQRVLQNLLDNAIKHHDRDAGVVRVEGERLEEQEGMVEIRVCDDGPGVDERQRERIFDLFQRLTRESDGKGTGIGLAVVRKIVEAHGGTVEVRSNDPEMGRGATFAFTWPVRHLSPAIAGTKIGRHAQ